MSILKSNFAIHKSIPAILIALSLTTAISSVVYAVDNRKDREGKDGMDDRDWRREYYGTPNFRINDDRRMAELNQMVLVNEDALDRINQAVSIKQTQFEQLKNTKIELEAKIANLSNDALKAVEKEQQLNQQKFIIEKEITQTEAALVQKRTALQTAEQELTSAVENRGVVAQSKREKEAALATAKTEFEQAMGACTAAGTDCGNDPRVLMAKVKILEFENVIRMLNENITKQNQVVSNKEVVVKTANAEVGQLVEKLYQSKARQTNIDVEIEALKKKNIERIATIREKESALATTQQNLTYVENDLRPMLDQQARIRQRFIEVIRESKAYRNDLIERIIIINHKAFADGGNTGSYDGAELSANVGANQGFSDGNSDGNYRGTQLGQDREYMAGHADGEVIGENRARKEGEADGTRLGTIQGNKDAGQREGIAKGIADAESSDAAIVGIAQGNKAGLDRAIRTGSTQGTSIGEAEVINKYEKRTLPLKTITGPFAGIFSKIIPRYPGPTNRSYDDRMANSFQRYLVQTAYKDGYRVGYFDRSERAFYDNIDMDYGYAYDTAEANAFEKAKNRYYKDYYESGKSKGESYAFNRVYPNVKSEFFDKFRNMYSANPNRSSEEYRTVFKTERDNTYTIKYEQIRLANYDVAEENTFVANIAEQTEKYRKLRFDVVESIYTKNPVLAFISSDILDAGINGVAANDGVYQPEEKVAHSLTIINFGKTDASDVTVTVSNGKVVKLPTIPAESQILVKGAALSDVSKNLKEGDTVNSTLKVFSKLTAEAKIQGRHFYNLSTGQINSGDVHSKKVMYPMSLGQMNTKGAVIFEKPNALRVTITNRSNRSYVGPITIEVDVDSKSNIITQNFSTVNTVEKSAIVDNAELLVSDVNDVYVPLTFKAVVKKNGVTLGYMNSPFSTMVKAPYIEKHSVPVIVSDSDSSSKELLDIIDTLGGIENVTVLDVSLAEMNDEIIKKGLDGKTIVAIEPSSGESVMRALDTMLKVSTQMPIILADDHNFGISHAKGLSSFVDAGNFIAKIDSNNDEVAMIFSNPLRSAGLKASNVAIQANMQNLDTMIKVAEIFTMTSDEVLVKISSTVNPTTILQPTAYVEMLLKTLNIKVIGEAMVIGIAYDKSKKGGWLGDRDKVILKRIKEDESLIFNKLDKATPDSVNDQTIGMALAGWSVAAVILNAVNYYTPITKGDKRTGDTDTSKIYDSVASKQSSVAWDLKKKGVGAVKKYSKSLMKEIDDNIFRFAPFVPGEEQSVDGF